ncbi:MAG TPA: hypothetical protein DD414_09785 [Lachnospiraceae bacterium]|nr:hypothetical protein [Lachnospiraceae bacterium]
MKNPVRYRKYYAVELSLASPLAVSGGEDYESDADLIRNRDGEVFVPGSSLAGALRNYISRKEDCERLFGYSQGEEGRMSAVSLSDLYFDRKAGIRVSLRDRVKLTEGKTVDNKFDQEVIETGARGILYLEYVIRKEQEEVDCEALIASLFQGMQDGEIRFGSDKNRGYGRVRILKIYEKGFGPEDVDRWIDFQRKDRALSDYEARSYEDWRQAHKSADAEKYVHIRVPLKQKGGISIRRYSTRPDKADYEHITCNGQPVIPGSSWNGAIRADAKSILSEAGVKKPEKVIGAWFGNLDGEDSCQSVVVVGESIVRDTVSLPMTRNKINRFDASTVDGALYSEISCMNGKTELELMVRKDAYGEYKAVMGLLYLVIRDIQKGYVAVGGQAAIGRGIFAADESRTVSCSEPLTEQECLAALYASVKGGREE